MLTQFFKSINWVDVALAALFIRVVFISVKTGFITETFKLLGVLAGLYLALHYYEYLATLVAQKTTLPIESWEFIFFVAIWGLAVLIFKFMRDGVLLLFKVETTHQGFDKYGAGVLGVLRAILLCSMTVFTLLLMEHPVVHRQVVSAYGYKATAKVAPNTYSFMFNNLIGKLFEGQKFNADVYAVVGSHGVNPK